jgi:hypothetical protein
MLHLLTEIVEQPQTTNFITDLFNSAFAQITAIGGAGIGGLILLFSKLLPSKNFANNITDKIFSLENTLKGEVEKVAELEIAQREYQDANDELLKELALLSPNTKAKELAKKLEEKKQALNVQEQIQAKVSEKTKELQAKVVSVLKKTELVKEE